MRRSPTNHKGSELPEALGTRYSDTHAETSNNSETDRMTDAKTPIELKYVPYEEGVEEPPPGEEEAIRKMIDALPQNNGRTFHKYQHAIRDAHAKSHGVGAAKQGSGRIFPSTCDRASSQNPDGRIRSSRACPPRPGRFAATRCAACAEWGSRSSA